MVLPGGTLAVFTDHFIGGRIMLLHVGYIKLTLAANANRHTMLSADVRSSLLLEAFQNSKSPRGAQTRIDIVDRLASSPNSTSLTEVRCLDFVESRSARGETGCLASQLEVTIYGKQLSATTSMRRVTPLPACAEACSTLTGDSAGHGSDVLLAVALVRVAKSGGIDSLLRCVLSP